MRPHTPFLAVSPGGFGAVSLALRSAVPLDGDRCRRLSDGVRLPAADPATRHPTASAPIASAPASLGPRWLVPAEAPLAPPVPPALPKIAPGRSLDGVTISPPPADGFGTVPAGTSSPSNGSEPDVAPSLSLFLLPASRWPGSHRPSAQAPPTQLDRIEQKLDTILHRLDQMQPGQAAGPPTAPAATHGVSSAPETLAGGALAIIHAAPATPSPLMKFPPTASVGSSTPAVPFSWPIWPIRVSATPASPASNGKAGCARKRPDATNSRSTAAPSAPTTTPTPPASSPAGWKTVRSACRKPTPPRTPRGPPPSRSSSVPSCSPASTSCGSGRYAHPHSRCAISGSRSRCWKKRQPISTCAGHRRGSRT